MVETTITVDDEIRDELAEHYRDPHHGTWTEFFEALMRILPTRGEMAECSYHDCDYQLLRQGPMEQWSGIIQWWAAEHGGSPIYGQAYYCSVECSMDAQEEINQMVPTDPAEVRVGGKDELAAQFDGSVAEYVMDGEVKELSISMPGVFGGDYDYVGEPVFLRNDRGEWVESAIVEDIIHEEAHTAIILESGMGEAALYHPDDEKREAKLESYCHWYDQDCPECGETLRVNEEMEDEVECGECGEVVEREPVEPEDLPRPVREYRAG